MMRKWIFTPFLLLFVHHFQAQIAINTSGNTPDGSAMLDVNSNAHGILIPRLGTNERDNNIQAPAEGLIIYNTDKKTFEFYDGTKWVETETSGKAWLLSGNAGTDGSQFLGTTDDQPLIFKTGNTERMQIKENGVIAINTTPNDNYLLNVSSSSHMHIGHFESTQTNRDVIGVYGKVDNTDWYGYGGYFVGGYKGVYAIVTPTGNHSYYGLESIVTGGEGTNYGVRTNVSGEGTEYGVMSIARYTGTNNKWSYGIYGTSSGDNAFNIGCLGTVNDASGTGIYASNHNDNGSALIAIGNNLNSFSYPTTGTGIVGNGKKVGVFGYGMDSGDEVFGGYFAAVGNNNQYAYVGGQHNGTSYKINGPGNVATIVRRPDGTRANMFAIESPEIYFQDYGTGRLVNGRAHIELDPVLVKNITVNDKHPLRVFIQPEGPCNGVYVTNKTGTGFDVVELNNGHSHIRFTWTVIANRADSYDENGKLVSKNADVRFPDGPAPIPHVRVKTDKQTKDSFIQSEPEKSSE